MEDVAKDVYQRDYSDQYPDYETWKKDKGLEAIIQEDTERRTPSKLSNALSSVASLIPFRYENEQIGSRLVRYDRFTSRVEWKSVFRESDNWRPSRFKNLQQAKAAFQRSDLESAAESAAEETNDKINDLNDSVDDIKREQEFRDIQRRFR